MLASDDSAEGIVRSLTEGCKIQRERDRRSLRLIERNDYSGRRNGKRGRCNVHTDLSAAKIGGNPLAGFKTFVTNPYLLTIAAFLLLYTMIQAVMYFEQTNLLRDFSREERTVILSNLAAVANLLTFGLGLFATSRLVTKLGMPTTLALVPVFMCAGLLILAFAPILMVFLALQIAGQAGNFGITRPSREMLFTHVDRETRFKSKPVIDVAVYRGGDALSSIAFAGLTDGVGLGMGAMAGIGPTDTCTNHPSC